MSFITFMNAPLASASNPALQDTVPGLIVPQPAIAPGGAALTFFTHAGGVMSAAWKDLPSGAALGMRLCDALAQGPVADDPASAAAPRQFELVAHWPGCRQTAPYKTSIRRRWTGGHLAYEVARMMDGFYKEFAKHVGEKGPERGWDVQNGDVPFEKLFLLELRRVGSDSFQPVLTYDAD